jgi:hypothetical protein
MSELESIPKQEAEDRIQALVVRVQNEERFTKFVPGSAWWLGSNKKDIVPVQIPFWEQLGITNKCFVGHFGRHWMSSLIGTVYPFNALRREKYGTAWYITVKQVHVETSYGSETTSPVDGSGGGVVGRNQIAVGRLLRSITERSDALRDYRVQANAAAAATANEVSATAVAPPAANPPVVAGANAPNPFAAVGATQAKTALSG